MKKSKIIALVLSVLILAGMSYLTYYFVENETFVLYYDSTEENIDKDFTITEFNSVVNVNTDSSYSVNEKITVVFNRYGKLGIYRDLPNNSGEKYRNIEVKTNQSQNSDWMSINRYGSFIEIALGYEDESTVYYPKDTEITFELSYELIVPETDNLDRVYLNINGNGWRTNIEKLTSKVILPSSVLADSTDLYVGKYGENNKGGNYNYAVTNEGDKSVITVECEDLKAYEGATLLTYLPKGTMSLYSDPIPTVIISVAAIVTLLAIVLVLLFRDKSILTPVTNYYPPKWDNKELSPVEMGVLIDGSCDDEDISSLIFYWASKGYLAIENIETKKPILIKLKDITVGNAREKALFDAIFSSGDKVSLDLLTNKLYTKVDALRTKSTLELNNRMYNGFGKCILFALITSAILSAFIIAVYAYCGFLFDGFPIAFIGLGLSLVSSLVSAEFKKREYKWTETKKILYNLILVAAGGLASTIGGLVFLHEDIVGKTGMAIIPFVYLIMGFMLGKAFKKKPEYNKILGDIVGFRNFLMLAEKERLEMLLEETPEYYYNILPYAQVLGVSEIWTEKFKAIPLQPPPYIYGYNGVFNYYYYYSLTRSMNQSFRTVATSRPASSGKSGGGGFGGGFGGGGFSGGGFGGGGGGSR